MSIEHQTVQIDRTRIREVIKLTVDAKSGSSPTFLKDIMFPEERFINILKQIGTETDSEQFPINALFLTTTFVRGGRTSLFFNNLTDLTKIAKFSWLFKPEEIVKKAVSEDDVRKSCLELFGEGGGGYALNAARKWYYNCALLHNGYGDDIRLFFKEHQNDALEIIKALEVRPRAKTVEKIKTNMFLGFGEKLAQLSIQWLHKYDLYKFNNIQDSGMPIDSNVLKILLQTGGLSITKRVNVDLLARRITSPILMEIFKNTDINPRDIQELWWHIGSVLCTNKLHSTCPLENICTKLVRNGSYQGGSNYSPSDIEPRG